MSSDGLHSYTHVYAFLRHAAFSIPHTFGSIPTSPLRHPTPNPHSSSGTTPRLQFARQLLPHPGPTYHATAHRNLVNRENLRVQLITGICTGRRTFSWSSHHVLDPALFPIQTSKTGTNFICFTETSLLHYTPCYVVNLLPLHTAGTTAVGKGYKYRL